MGWDPDKGDIKRKVPYTFKNPRTGETMDYTFEFSEDSQDGRESSSDDRPGGRDVGVQDVKYY